MRCGNTVCAPNNKPKGRTLKTAVWLWCAFRPDETSPRGPSQLERMNTSGKSRQIPKDAKLCWNIWRSVSRLHSNMQPAEHTHTHIHTYAMAENAGRRTVRHTATCQLCMFQHKQSLRPRQRPFCHKAAINSNCLHQETAKGASFYLPSSKQNADLCGWYMTLSARV